MHFFSKLLLVSIFCITSSSSICALPITGKIIDSFAQKYGTEPLSPEHEAFVLAIVREIGITTPIKFRYMNFTALEKWGLYNAVAYLDSYVFISKYFFEKLTKKEQRFVIGHELSHIKQHYTKINLPIAWLAIGISYLGAIATWNLSKDCSYVHKVCASSGIYMAMSLVTQISRAYLTRYYEYDADRKSALSLNNAQDGISFINHMGTIINNSSLKQKNPDSLPWIKQLFITHPTNKQRIAYLETCINPIGAP